MDLTNTGKRAAGETRTLQFQLRPEDLQYWSAATGDYVNDCASFDLYIGSDSTATLSGSFSVKAP